MHHRMNTGRTISALKCIIRTETIGWQTTENQTTGIVDNESNNKENSLHIN